MAGVAATAGVVLAWFAAQQWRNQARHLRQAEVAGEALVASQRLLDAARGASGIYVRDRTVPSLKAAVEQRWERIAEVDRQFQLALHRATAYLPDRALEVMNEFEEVRRRIQRNQRVWAQAADGEVEETKETKELHEKAFTGRLEVINKVEKRTIDVLKPIARIEAKKVQA